MKILTVCTGNTCRSPFAAAYFNKRFAQLGSDCAAKSAGLFAPCASHPCDEAIAAAEKYGLGDVMKNHTSRNITESDVLGSDVIFALSPEHYRMLRPKVDMLNESRKDGKTTAIYILGNGIDDPYGGDAEIYEKCYEKIAGCAENVIKELFDA